MKIYKRMVIALGVIAILIGGSFAIFKDMIFVDIPTDTLSNLSMRYDEKFKFVGYIEDEYSINEKGLEFKGKYGRFQLSRYYDENNNLQYEDNYLGYRYLDIFKQHIDSLLERMNGDFTYEIDIAESDFPINTTADTQLVDLLESDDTYFYINIVSSSAWSDEDILEFAEGVDATLDARARVGVITTNEKVSFKDFYDIMRSTEDKYKNTRVYFGVSGDGGLEYTDRR